MAGELADPWAEKQLERLLEIDRAARAVVAYWRHADPTGEFALPHEKALIRAVALEGIVVELPPLCGDCGAVLSELAAGGWFCTQCRIVSSDKKGRR